MRRRNTSAPDTQSTSRGRSQSASSWRYRRVKRLRGPTPPEHRVADRVDRLDVRPRADGYCVPSGLRSAGPTAARSGSASKRASIAAAVPGLHLEVGVADRDDRCGRRARCRGWRRRRTRGCRPASTTRTVGERGARASATRPVGASRCRRRRPRASPALVSASSDRTHASSSGPASKFTTTAAQRGAGAVDHARQSTKRYLTRVQSATKPSRQVIFLPSSNSRPVYEIGTS